MPNGQYAQPQTIQPNSPIVSALQGPTQKLNDAQPAPTPGQINNVPGGSTVTQNGAPNLGYVNSGDPTQAAVLSAYQQKGITPRDQSDFQYWVDKINGTGGMGDTGNANYWTSRMAQGQGGVGDYSTGGGGSSSGMPSSSAQAIMSALAGGANMTPDYSQQLIAQVMQQLATQNALNAK